MPLSVRIIVLLVGIMTALVLLLPLAFDGRTAGSADERMLGIGTPFIPRP